MRNILDDIETSINQVFGNKQEQNAEESVSDEEPSSQEKPAVVQNNQDNAVRDFNEKEPELQNNEEKNVNSDSTERDEGVSPNHSLEMQQTPQSKFLEQLCNPDLDLTERLEMFK